MRCSYSRRARARRCRWSAVWPAEMPAGIRVATSAVCCLAPRDRAQRRDIARRRPAGALLWHSSEDGYRRGGGPGRRHGRRGRRPDAQRHRSARLRRRGLRRAPRPQLRACRAGVGAGTGRGRSSGRRLRRAAGRLRRRARPTRQLRGLTRCRPAQGRWHRAGRPRGHPCEWRCRGDQVYGHLTRYLPETRAAWRPLGGRHPARRHQDRGHDNAAVRPGRRVARRQGVAADPPRWRHFRRGLAADHPPGRNHLPVQRSQRPPGESGRRATRRGAR
jgi:hypothetical protein